MFKCPKCDTEMIPMGESGDDEVYSWHKCDNCLSDFFEFWFIDDEEDEANCS